ncbi:hypothetical protein JOF56_009631 [Kibdelosporangium banguiense]|uniref:PDZ domain-containing protein n=1 Tax=Kibdelosporangium banguiense TaxID=1365924 RepID=A0ABS4TZA2_9PSEU|nr:hypothetical protein [Kibdelosporangium banguiense]MBP2329246.1 hypothetical protein [Kibdelosporangium banguiense]
MTPPTLALTLTPAADGFHVEYIFDTPAIPANRTICRLPAVIVGIPGAPVRAADLRVTDALGPLTLHEEDEPATGSFTYRRWFADRDTSGPVTIAYFAAVRIVTGNTKNGPLFDLRAEAGGVSGAGVTFLALPDFPGPCAITIEWRGHGVSSFGEGTAAFTGPLQSVAFAYFMAGPVSRCHAAGLTMYWLTEPRFDAAAVASRTGRIYQVMCDFFREPEPGHQVFVRRHPYPGIAGTAMTRSFVLGYQDCKAPTADELAAVLAHETAHNWPKLDGDHGETSWYSEGTAEYYSIVLSHRAGLLDDAQFLQLLNERARRYCTNPLQGLTSAQAAEMYWADQRAQRVPYERGLFYFIDLDAKIRSATAGARSLDNLVLTVLDRQRAGGTVSVPDWLDLVAAELGETARSDFEAMRTGQRIVPPPDALGPRFTLTEVPDHMSELGFAITSLESRVVTGLIAGSAAETAGVAEGDRILAGPTGSDVSRGVGTIVLKLQRGTRTLTVDYAPIGAETSTYQWAPC